MKITFDNLGALRCGEIEIKNFTVLCGENNTGKTYLTYTLYGLLKYFGTELDLLGRTWQSKDRKGLLSIDLDDLRSNLESRIDDAARKYTKRLGGILAGPDDRFSSTAISLSLDAISDFRSASYTTTIFLDSRDFIAIEKREGDNQLRIKATGEAMEEFPRSLIRRVITDALVEIMFRDELPRAFIVSTERTGAVTFRSELNLTKNRLIEAAHEIDAKAQRNPMVIWELLQKSAYPLPVRDNLDFLTTLSSGTTRTSFITKEHPYLINEFSDLIGGTFGVDKQTSQVFFQPTASPSLKLSMGESSSSVRSLLPLGFYLKHFATKGDLLMVDEPELNLHPRNQRRLARLLARLSNLGLRVFITTHSDYIVRELNNLILLKGLGPRGSNLLKKYGYGDDDLLDAESFALYTLVSEQFRAAGEARAKRAKRVRIRQANVSAEDGIDGTTFDDTIHQMNELYRDILTEEVVARDGAQ